MPDHSNKPKSSILAATVLLAGLLVLALGYWGPWVWADAAGLRVIGVDLPEYVKFIAEVRSGQVRLVRESFYLPLLALSLGLSLAAHQPRFPLPSLLRWLLNLLACPTALALLPPAWTPALLATPEFLKQTLAIAACLAAATLSWPLLRRLPGWAAPAFMIPLAAVALVLPITAFVRLRPSLAAIYGAEITVGRGPWMTSAGLALLAMSTWLAYRRGR